MNVKLGIGGGDGGQITWPFLMGVSREERAALRRTVTCDARDVGSD
jgi:hypothetical protein